ncbi:radical SAM protein [Hyperthermus butylicus]|uniref:Conserved archaeal protein n=1 Tax=Hyperthermus butylicus (strain DSM 5456 / JCM 9403 / PLM1-5) TaxID=415426 RepID=A2BL81_HYPBU|nr:radical SAM protein [Hyperthermus butylicus]ABM80742.1 conserved archaeal protein [Hyperthermus butylicus DSM 5456]
MVPAAPRRVYRVDGVYVLLGVLPRGCRLCIEGAKLVVFVTGLCDERCFYCPVSSAKLYRDVIYADEELVKRLEDIIDEAYSIGADGASITGGDPLVVLDRTMRVIKTLKTVFGPDFHIHLYTSGRYATADTLRELERAGLDEIRFHIVNWSWGLERLRRALEVVKHMDVGVEVPVFPDRVEELKRLILELDKMGVSFVNLNELEVSERNIHDLLLRGYRVSPNKPIVYGSEEAAVEIVEWATRMGVRLTVHYCPARYKDRVQMRIRLIRKAIRLAKPYQRVTPSGMLEYAVIPEDRAPRQWGELLERLKVGYAGPASLAEMVPSARIVRVYPSRRLASRLPSEVDSIAE